MNSRPSDALPFVKMHGAGNDYVYVDAFAHPIPDPAALAIRVADRRTGIGGDGLILIAPSEHADARMRIYNADGSEAETCGNGLRCVVKFLHDRGRVGERCRIETGAGVVAATIRSPIPGDPRAPSTIAVEMGAPRWDRADIPMTGTGSTVDVELQLDDDTIRVTALGLGNPHCVVFVDDVEQAPLEQLGPALQAHELFPASVNVEFVQVVDGQTLRQRTYERGSGETWACGSGAVAAALAALHQGRVTSPVRVELRGGTLSIHHDGGSSPAVMEGPAVQVFEGRYPIPAEAERHRQG